jgi:hypothetical protein
MALRTLEAQGRFDLAVGVAAGKLPDAWTARTAGDLGMILEKGEEGIRWSACWMSPPASTLGGRGDALVRLTLRRAGGDETVALDGSEAGTASTCGPLRRCP